MWPLQRRLPRNVLHVWRNIYNSGVRNLAAIVFCFFGIVRFLWQLLGLWCHLFVSSLPPWWRCVIVCYLYVSVCCGDEIGGMIDTYSQSFSTFLFILGKMKTKDVFCLCRELEKTHAFYSFGFSAFWCYFLQMEVIPSDVTSAWCAVINEYLSCLRTVSQVASFIFYSLIF